MSEYNPELYQAMDRLPRRTLERIRSDMQRSYSSPDEARGNTFQQQAIEIVYDYVRSVIGIVTHPTFHKDEVYVVWWAKILQNWKCLVSTTLPDGRYYEVTYNGDRNECYLDVYQKQDNLRIQMEPPVPSPALSDYKPGSPPEPIYHNEGHVQEKSEPVRQD